MTVAQTWPAKARPWPGKIQPAMTSYDQLWPAMAGQLNLTWHTSGNGQTSPKRIKPTKNIQTQKKNNKKLETEIRNRKSNSEGQSAIFRGPELWAGVEELSSNPAGQLVDQMASHDHDGRQWKPRLVMARHGRPRQNPVSGFGLSPRRQWSSMADYS